MVDPLSVTEYGLRTTGSANDQFGRAVAISGDTVVVGAPRDDDKANDTGSAYIFVRSGVAG